MPSISEHEEYLKKIDKTNKDLFESFKKLKSISRKEDYDIFLGQYEKESRKLAVYKFIAEKKREELNIAERGYLSVKEFIKENNENTSQYLSVFGKVLVAKAGATLAQALKDEWEGKDVDFTKLGTELGKQTAEAILSGVAAAFIGPVGGTMVNMGFSMIFPEPPKEDIYLKKFNELDKKLDKKFEEIKNSIKELDDSIDTRFYKWSQYIKDATTFEITVKARLNEKFIDFETKLKKIESHYENLVLKNYHQIDENELLNLMSNLEIELHNLIDIVYKEKNVGKTNKNIIDDCYSLKLIEFNKKDNEKFRSFIYTTEELLICFHKLQALVEYYFLQLKKLKKCLQIVYINFGSIDSNNSDRIFKILFDNKLNESESKAKILAKVYFLHNKTIGPNNISLYEKVANKINLINDSINDSVETDITFMDGFALTDVSDKNKQLNIGFQTNEKFNENPFSFSVIEDKNKNKNYVNRYVIGKRDIDTKEQDFSMTLLSLQKNPFLVPNKFNIALNIQDTLTLYSKDFQYKVNTKVVHLNDIIFENSLEYVILNSKEYTFNNNEIIKLSIPNPNFELNVSVHKASLNNNSSSNLLRLWISEKNSGIYIKDLLKLNDYYDFGKLLKFEKLPYRKGRESYGISFSETQNKYSFLEFKSQRKSQYSTKLRNIGVFNTGNGIMIEKLNNVTFYQTYNLASPDSNITNMASANGLYFLKKDNISKIGTVLNLYNRTKDSEKKIGSVFREYNYKFSGRNHEYKFQKDGNLVGYEDRDHPFTATNTNKYEDCTLLLNNDGSLRIMSKNVADEKENLKIYENDIKFSESLINGLLPNKKLKLGEKISSPNGEYFLEFEKMKCERHVYFNNKIYQNENKYSFNIELNFCSVWERVNNINLLKDKIIEITQSELFTELKLDRLTPYNGGDLTMDKNKGLIINSNVGVPGIQYDDYIKIFTLWQKSDKEIDSFLEITNNGELNIKDANGDKTLFQIAKIQNKYM